MGGRRCWCCLAFSRPIDFHLSQDRRDKGGTKVVPALTEAVVVLFIEELSLPFP